MDPSYRPTRRRSVPRLPEFSITPLRTQLEATFADDHAGHSYSQPQTPRSPRSAFHSPAHTPTVLSRAPSRDSSRSGGRRRKVKSALLLADLERPLSQIKTSDDNNMPKKSKSSLRLQKVQSDVPAHTHRGHTPKAKSLGLATSSASPRTSNQALGGDWLLSTASVLAMTAAESKGQSWLATKSASTSLAGTPYIEKDEFMFKPMTRLHDEEDLLASPASSSHPASRRNSLPSSSTGPRPKSRGGSRNASRITSRVGSRVNLMSGLTRKTPGETDRHSDYFANMGVDFADQDDIDAEDDSSDELDDFEESELKKLVWGRVGGWVDWAVGWMDWRDELKDLDDEAELAKEDKPRRRKRATIKLDPEVEDAAVRNDDAEGQMPVPPPPQQAGLIGDAKWLVGVASKLIV